MNFKELSTMGKVKMILAFVPVITSVAWLLMWLLGANFADFIGSILSLCIMVGWVSAILSAPLEILKLLWKLLCGGVRIGYNIVPFIPLCFATAVVGGIIGLYAVILLLFFAPGAISIYAYLKREEII